MHRALITGGTSGIGAAFARAFAARGTALVLVARDPQRLEETAATIRREHGVEVETLAADLSDRAEQQRVADRLESATDPVDVLVNNAGFSVRASLLDADISQHDLGFEVMIRAVLKLGGAAGRGMAARGRGWIINVGSVSALVTQNNYSAIKAWVGNYSESLGVQLAGTGVNVTALMPGWVRTEFHDRAGINASKLPGFVWIEADKLVRSCLADAEKGRIESIPDLKWKIAMFIGDHGPRGLARLVSRMLTASRKKH